jgi:hypothetical protein
VISGGVVSPEHGKNLVKLKSEPNAPCRLILNEVGARIWELIDRGRSVQQIEQLLLEEFDTTPEQLEEDLLRVLDQLQELGAIEAVAG